MGFSSPMRMIFDFSDSNLLPLPTRTRAGGPVRPFSENAVDRECVFALHVCVAGFRFLQVRLARSTPVHHLGFDHTLTKPLSAIAGLGAVTPIPPVRESTIHSIQLAIRLAI